MRRVILYIFVVLCTMGCTKNTKEIEQEFFIREQAEQVTLMYLMGTDLSRFYKQNIEGAKSAIERGALGRHGRFYYSEADSYDSMTLYEMKQNVLGALVVREVKSYDLNSYSEGALSQVITDIKSDLGSEEGDEPRFNLIASSHGTGWVLTQHTSISSGKRLVYEDRFSEWEPLGSTIKTRYLGCTNDGSMNIEDLRKEIASADVKFGYIIFDACFMSSVESLYRVRECADYIVASPCEIMGDGFPYKTIVPQLFTDDGREFDLQRVCEKYHDYYTQESYIKSGCIAMCVTSELEALAEAQKALTLSPISDLGALQSYEGRTDHIFFDLRDYIDHSAEEDSYLAAYYEQFDRAFPAECRLSTDSFYSLIGDSGYTKIHSYSGVTTSAPTTAKSYDTEWLDEPWAVATTTAVPSVD